MSTIESILNRMMNEPAFAEAVFTDAEMTLAEYNLPAEEFSRLNKISRADFEKFASTAPEERKSFSVSTSTVRGGGFYQIRDEGG
jgi:hypothetical protein